MEDLDSWRVSVQFMRECRIVPLVIEVIDAISANFNHKRIMKSF